MAPAQGLGRLRPLYRLPRPDSGGLGAAPLVHDLLGRLRVFGRVPSKAMKKALAFLLLASGCGVLTPTKVESPAGVTVIYRPNTKARLSPNKLKEVDARLKAVLDCLPPEVICTDEQPDVYVTSACLLEKNGDGGSYDPKVKRIYVPRSLGALAHEAVHHYTCTYIHGGKSWSHLCGNKIDSAFRAEFPPECSP